MPFDNIKVAGPTLSSGQVHQLQQGATGLMVEIMRKVGDLTAVLVEQVPVGNWTVGGQPALAAAHLDVKVTAGTNSAAEKERFVAEAMELLRNVIGPELNPVTYVVVHEVAADAWGWSGQTQAGRAAAKTA